MTHDLFEDLPEYLEPREDLLSKIADRIMKEVVEPIVEHVPKWKQPSHLVPGHWNYDHIIQVMVHEMKEHQDKLSRMDDLSNRNE